ncbi:MAG: ISL3 family transposase [Proteobacteria bacterium]|nr:MAG: ISL3 family transposase [Pseudomonadota bacterium]
MLDTNVIFAAALGITEPWYVESVEFNSEAKKLEIHLNFKKGSKFPFFNEDGSIESNSAYDTVEKRWRHLNFFQHECYLIARIPRIKNQADKIQTYSPDWGGLSNGFTLLFEAVLLQLAKDMPVNRIAKLLNVSDKLIWYVLERYVSQAREFENYEDVSKIGVDETSLSKGHNYISMFVDLEKRRTIFVAEGRSNETVKQFKNDFTEHNGDVLQITDVSCDMSPAFIKGVKENLPNAEITFDKFHVLKIINEAVDTVRREEVKHNPILLGKRYIFLKNEVNLTAKQRQEKQKLILSEVNLKSMEALNMRETFQQIYHAQSDIEFVLLLTKWHEWVSNSALEPMKKSAEMVKKHWDGIVQWKKSQINNGILEGLNSVIQAAKRKARGYKMKHLKTIAYLVTSNLNFGKLNYACQPTEKA